MFSNFINIFNQYHIANTIFYMPRAQLISVIQLWGPVTRDCIPNILDRLSTSELQTILTFLVEDCRDFPPHLNYRLSPSQIGVISKIVWFEK